MFKLQKAQTSHLVVNELGVTVASLAENVNFEHLNERWGKSRSPKFFLEWYHGKVITWEGIQSFLKQENAKWE